MAEEVVRDGNSPVDFDGFFRLEHPKMVAIALSMTGRAEPARDIAQDACVTAFQQWPRVSMLEKPGAWLRRITINRAIDWQRRHSRERRATQRLRLVDASAPIEPEHRFWEAVRALPERQRAATVLRYVEDRSVADIAETLEIAEGTVKATLSKARANLAKSLADIVTDTNRPKDDR
jgi:RNA polymerase sigma-70 factor (ECF subfamily)